MTIESTSPLLVVRIKLIVKVTQMEAVPQHSMTRKVVQMVPQQSFLILRKISFLINSAGHPKTLKNVHIRDF